MSSVALAGSIAQARFAPPIGKVIRQTIVEERRDGASVQRFEVERQLTFTVATNGFVLELVTKKISDPGSTSGAMFANGMAAIVGKTIRFRLDTEGHVISIDDEEAIWSAICDGIDRMGQGPPGLAKRRQANVKAMSALLRALPPERRRAMLASMFASILAGPLADRATGDDRLITVPGRSVAGIAATLAGRERIKAGDTPGQTIVDTQVEGKVPLPGVAPIGEARMNVTVEQRIDRATGLVLDLRERRETTIDNSDGPRRSISLTIMHLDPGVL